MTNLEKIQAMDAFDLAEFLQAIGDSCFNVARYGTEACEDCPLNGTCGNNRVREWLESEVEEQ